MYEGWNSGLLRVFCNLHLIVEILEHSHLPESRRLSSWSEWESYDRLTLNQISDSDQVSFADFARCTGTWLFLSDWWKWPWHTSSCSSSSFRICNFACESNLLLLDFKSHPRYTSQIGGNFQFWISAQSSNSNSNSCSRPDAMQVMLSASRISSKNKQTKFQSIHRFILQSSSEPQVAQSVVKFLILNSDAQTYLQQVLSAAVCYSRSILKLDLSLVVDADHKMVVKWNTKLQLMMSF